MLHFYATGATVCLYCSAPAACAGEPCPARAAEEAAWTRRTGQPYDPLGALRAAAGRVGARVAQDQAQRGATPVAFVRVLADGRVLAEAEGVVAEIAARVCLARLRGERRGAPPPSRLAVGPPPPGGRRPNGPSPRRR